MRIGIDLDNTIIDYNSAFKKYIFAKKILIQKKNLNKNNYLTKSILKSKILKLKKGNIFWQKIQGQIYGKYINMADIYSGFKRFVFLSNLRNFEIFIVSHKTKYGHFDKSKTLLRNSAIKFLKKNEFFISNKYPLKKNNIFFSNTRDEKIKIINQLNLDYFIDDLPEVLLDKKFSKKTKKILINNEKNIKNKKFFFMNDWGEITKYFFNTLSKQDILRILEFMQIKNYQYIKKIKGGVNSKVFKVKIKNKDFCLKIYPINKDKRERCITEFNAFNYLRKNKIYNTPKSLKIDQDLNIAMYSWVEGSKLKNFDIKNVNNLINFIKKLKNISEKAKLYDFKEASESSINLSNIYIFNKNRIKILKNNKINYKRFYDHILRIEEINNYQNLKLRQFLKRKKLSCNLSKEKLILSPSDISLKNIINKNKKDFYIDFEYFGWDDPCKMLSDIIWHPSIKMNNLNYKEIINYFTAIFYKDKFFLERLAYTFNLYGVRWSLIMLNNFNNNENHDFKTLNFQTKKELLMQLKKSKKTIENVLDDKYKRKYLNYEYI